MAHYAYPAKSFPKESSLRDKDVLLKRGALALTGFGLLLLLIRLGAEVYYRISDGQQFDRGFLDSGAGGYYFMISVGYIFAGSSIYGLGRVGRIFGEVIGLIVLWQVSLWYSTWQTFSMATSTLQLVEGVLIILVFLITCAVIVYLPFTWFKSGSSGTVPPRGKITVPGGHN